MDPGTGDPIVSVTGPPPEKIPKTYLNNPFRRGRPAYPFTQVNKPRMLSEQDIKEIYAPKKSHRRSQDLDQGPYYPILADKPGMYQADTMKMNPTFGSYIGLVVLVSINRKIAWAEPIKSTSAQHVGERLLKCIDEIRHRFQDTVHKIETDAGTEFQGVCQKMLEDRNIQLTQNNPNVGSKTRTGIVERLIRTFKLWLGQFLMMYSDEDNGVEHKDWVSYVPELLHWYNYEHVHRSIGRPPADADEQTEHEYFTSALERDQQVDAHWKSWMADQQKKKHHVRIFIADRDKNKFSKEGKTGRWTKEKYNFPKSYGGGPSLIMIPEGQEKPVLRRPMPYNLKYF